MSQTAVQKQEEKLLKKAEEKELIREVYAAEGRKRPPIQENRSLAKAVLAGVLALCILVIGPIKLSVRRNSALKSFKQSTESAYDNSVYKQIRSAAAECRSMLSEIMQNEDAYTKEKTDALSAVLDRIDAESDENKLYELYSQMLSQSTGVYNEYAREMGSQASGSVYRRYNDGIQRSVDSINDSAYWKDAASYNNARGGFPASLWGGLYGIDYIPDKTGK